MPISGTLIALPDPTFPNEHHGHMTTNATRACRTRIHRSFSTDEAGKAKLADSTPMSARALPSKRSIPSPPSSRNLGMRIMRTSGNVLSLSLWQLESRTDQERRAGVADTKANRSPATIVTERIGLPRTPANTGYRQSFGGPSHKAPSLLRDPADPQHFRMLF
ncbi:hypothetical protein RB213_001125 [Colletotrichum asianum]